MRYNIICIHCGAILMKTKHSAVATLEIEIKCPNRNCPKKLLKIPDDTKIIPEMKPTGRPRLDK